ncbi:PIG-L deacetylase family protein [Nonomuraea sp. NPDC049684]|uniref:PIG-L deacetylase family protein n=1 Tax=Nonomuraea sp. NPDC049684 TaxID=3364356 RepID=UPI0037B8F2F8
MLRTLVIAAHPDEPEIYAGGTAALLARSGHAVKFLTLTNGDAGHHELERGPLARRRAEEAWRAADALGVVDYEIFDVHDGMLEPTVELRLRVLAQIRAWRPDLVIALHADGGGHPDNRAAGQLAAHAVEFAMTRNLEVGKPALKRMPVCLLMTDYASAPVHRPDVVVDVSSALTAKLDACLAHASQFLEFAPWQRGFLDQAPPPGDVAAGRAFVLEHWAEFLKEETFQFAGYGRKADREEIGRLLAGAAVPAA